MDSQEVKKGCVAYNMTEHWVVKTLGKKYHYVDMPVDGKDTSYCGIHLYFAWERAGHELVPNPKLKKLVCPYVKLVML